MNQNNYISYLDGFRGYAILLVILSHLGFLPMDIAYFGVTLFFFVSGLLITRLMVREHAKTGKISLKDFYLRRVFRLYPALLLMLLLSCTIVLFHGYKIIWNDIMSGIFYFTNYYLVYFEPIVQDSKYLLVSRILWSLSVEEHFYLLFPLLFIFFFSENSKLFLYIIGILLIAFLLTRILTLFSLDETGRIFKTTYYTTHCRADSILFGCFAALLLYKYESGWYLYAIQKKIVIICALILLAFSILYNDSFYQYTFKYTFQGIALMFIIPAFSYLSHHNILKKAVDNTIMIFIGKLSYSLYLFHWVALKTSSLYFTAKTFNWYCLTVFLTIILSILSYYYIEKPFLKLRVKYGSSAVGVK